VNISIIIRLAWNQFRYLVQYSVLKRITVSSEQVQGKNIQMFVVNKIIQYSCSFINILQMACVKIHITFLAANTFPSMMDSHMGFLS
jgi:hypothetical protein